LSRWRSGRGVVIAALWCGLVVIPLSNLAWQVLTNPFWNLFGPWDHIQKITIGFALAVPTTIYLSRSRRVAWFLTRDEITKVFD
jgi:hypothetical protein